MKPALATLFLAIPLVLAPGAAGAAPTCDAATQHTETPTGVYLLPENGVNGRHVWIESNLVMGLQKTACIDADGALVQADHDAGVVGIAQGGQPVCTPRVGCIWI